MTEPSKPKATILKLLIKRRSGGVAVGITLVLLVLLGVLFLPPISLAGRLLAVGYQTIGAEGETIRTSDGGRIVFLPSASQSDLLVKIDTVARDSFLDGTGGRELRPAAEKLPAYLSLQSTLYLIQRREKGLISRAVRFAIPVLDGQAAPHALDLYTWNGESWEWLPHRRISTGDILEAELEFLPGSVAVMQINSVEPRLSSDLYSVENLPTKDLEIPVIANPVGLFVEENGQIGGDLVDTAPEINDTGLAIIPTIRNWAGEKSNRANPVDQLLTDEGMRRDHIQALVELVQGRGYAGIDLDYRRINPELSREYTAFLAELRDALPGSKQLVVRLDLPHRLSTGVWDTGAYDWQAIGQIADGVKLSTWPDPKAYAAGGQMETMLEWAVSQINRSKMQLLVRTGSVEFVDGQVFELTDREAFEKMGEVVTLNPPAVIDPGQEIAVTLRGQPASTGIQVDETDGTYWFAYLDEDNRHHTIYLRNAGSLSNILKYVSRYRLSGIAIQNAHV